LQVERSQSRHAPVRAALAAPKAGPTIGLVNLMPLAAMRRTEDEFRALLQAETTATSLRCFAPHQAGRRNHSGLETSVEPLEALWAARLDALIVTGAEPRAASMQEEPLFPILRQLVEWSANNTASAMFSCFAAHAAVWCLDEIPRRLLPEKLSGIFECHKSAAHPIVAHLPDTWLTPHSRHNTLDEHALTGAGYAILSRSPRLGADMFAKTCGGCEFLFVQGHPEYGAGVLLDEYRRDLKRYQAGTTSRAPSWPENYRESENAWRRPAFQLMQGWISLFAAMPAGRQRAAVA